MEHNCREGAFNLELAVAQVADTIRRHLLDVMPPGVPPVEGLTEPLIMNLARHVVMLRCEYGRSANSREPHEYVPDEDHGGCTICGEGVCHHLHVEC